ncbi:MAG: hypothetical protein M3R06_02475 [Chloroflexota bacterium]|nr:hypothetical protein [Chloroflexota bacterium]
MTTTAWTSSSTAGPPRPGAIRSFAAIIEELSHDHVRDGDALTDMRRAPSLETQLAGVPDTARISVGQTRIPHPDFLEGAPDQIKVPRVQAGHSKLRSFLDGTQRTLPIWRVGLIPVVGTIAAAAVLSRDADGVPTIAPGTLRLKHALLAPVRSPEPDLKRLLNAAESAGMTIVDPLEREGMSEETYSALLGDYGKLIEFAYDRARRYREELELALLSEWTASEAHANSDSWLVFDGQLRLTRPRTIGLVKQFSQQHFGGAEAAALLGLPPGYRSRAFRPEPGDNWRGLGVDEEADERAASDRTLWYLRFWDATGLDARHALVRVEAGPEVREPAQITELSSWLMGDRTPRATADARWATLLYPIHYLERILKRRLAGETIGWPGSQ